MKDKKVAIKKPDKEDIHPTGFNMNIKVNPKQTAESLMEYGFTNHRESTLYYSKILKREVMDSNFSMVIGFNLCINKEKLEIERLDVLDENWCQPYNYQSILMENSDHEFATEIYHSVNELLSQLQEDEIITGFEVGMYV